MKYIHASLYYLASYLTVGGIALLIIVGLGVALTLTGHALEKGRGVS